MKEKMGWRGRWSGRGPFSDLPPWERPGRIYGKGACYRLHNLSLQTTIPSATHVAISKDQEITTLENQAKLSEQTLNDIRKRLEELKK